MYRHRDTFINYKSDGCTERSKCRVAVTVEKNKIV